MGVNFQLKWNTIICGISVSTEPLLPMIFGWTTNISQTAYNGLEQLKYYSMARKSLTKWHTWEWKYIITQNTDMYLNIEHIPLHRIYLFI